MIDRLGDYINSIIAGKDAEINAELDKIIAEKNKIIAEQYSRYITYLIVEMNKTNEEIKQIFSDVDDDFINGIRKIIKC